MFFGTRKAPFDFSYTPCSRRGLTKKYVFPQMYTFQKTYVFETYIFAQWCISPISLTDVTRLNYFEVARAAFFSKYCQRQVQRNSACRASPLTMDNDFVYYHVAIQRSPLMTFYYFFLIHDVNPSQLGAAQ